MAFKKEYQDMAKTALQLFKQNGGAGITFFRIVDAAFPNASEMQRHRIKSKFVSEKGDFQAVRNYRERLMSSIDRLVLQERKGKPKGKDNPIRATIPLAEFYFDNGYGPENWPTTLIECNRCIAGVATIVGFKPTVGLALQGDNELTRYHLAFRRLQKNGKVRAYVQKLQGAYETASPGPEKDALLEELASAFSNMVLPMMKEDNAHAS